MCRAVRAHARTAHGWSVRRAAIAPTATYAPGPSTAGSIPGFAATVITSASMSAASCAWTASWAQVDV
jgi:hypothetical protein